MTPGAQVLQALERAAVALEAGDAEVAGEALSALESVTRTGERALEPEELSQAKLLQQRCEEAAARLQRALTQALRSSGQANRAAALYAGG